MQWIFDTIVISPTLICNLHIAAIDRCIWLRDIFTWINFSLSVPLHFPFSSILRRQLFTQYSEYFFIILITLLIKYLHCSGQTKIGSIPWRSDSLDVPMYWGHILCWINSLDKFNAANIIWLTLPSIMLIPNQSGKFIQHVTITLNSGFDFCNTEIRQVFVKMNHRHLLN